MLGIVWRHQGRLEEATAHLERAVALAGQIPDHMSLVESSGELGKCYLCQGRWQQALEVLEAQQQGRGRVRREGDSLGRFLNSLAEAYLMAAEQDDPAAKEGWLRKAGPACRAARKQGRAFRPGMAETMRLRGVRVADGQAQWRTEVVAASAAWRWRR